MRKIFVCVVMMALFCAVMSIAASAELTIDIQRNDTVVVVTVLDSNGKPCEICDVKVKDSDGTPLIVGRTDDAGKFEFDIYGLEHVKVLVTNASGEAVEKSVENAIGSNKKQYEYDPENEKEQPEDSKVTEEAPAEDGGAKEIEDNAGGALYAKLLILLAIIAAVVFGRRLFSRMKG